MAIPERPLVSVIIATYNRSNILGYSIESARRSRFSDWEMLVIGDACTDDSATVVAAFADPRIRFDNLPANVGEQSGPNNDGMRRARGKYFAFLNHDDLWFPDHLERAVHVLDETGADLVFTQRIIIGPAGTSTSATPASGRYGPHMRVPASTWVFRRELFAEVGPWSHFRDCWRVPSQDWLHRAWRRRKRLLAVPAVTVLVIPSGGRARSYSERHFVENRRYFERMVGEPGFRDTLLAEIAAADANGGAAGARALGSALYRIYGRALGGLGIDPPPVREFFARARKGGVIDTLRRMRGLPALK